MKYNEVRLEQGNDEDFRSDTAAGTSHYCCSPKIRSRTRRLVPLIELSKRGAT
jgi:hypothetical protein